MNNIDKNLHLTFFLLLSIVLVFQSCSTEPDFDGMTNEILDLHKASIRAHIEKDAEFFTRDLADSYFSVGNGEIRHPNKQEIFDQFNAYLGSTEFSKYYDLEEPLIGFSEDGTLAWSIVRVKVAGERKLNGDSVKYFNTTWAWISLYKKEADKWLRMGEVSSHN